MPWSAWQDGYDNTVNVPAAAEFSNGLELDVDLAPATTVTPSDLAAQVAAMLAGTAGIWDDFASGVAEFVMTLTMGPVTDPLHFTYSYNGVTLLGSSAEAELPDDLPDDLPDTAGEIPSGELDDRCLDGLVQFETLSNTFLAWQDNTVGAGKYNVWTDDGGNTATSGYPAGTGPYSFTPPSAAPFLFGATDPVTAIGPQSGTMPDGTPRYPGPHLLPADVDALTPFTVDVRSTDRAGAPYTTDAALSATFELIDSGITVTIGMSGESRKDLTLLLMPSYFDGTTALPVSGDFGSNDKTMTFWAVALSQFSSGGTLRPWFNSVRFPASMHSPRWRYWVTDAAYTVGGHWADPNGVQVKRLKDDGVTWVPIVDGLAPPLL